MNDQLSVRTFLAVAREPIGLTHLEAWGLRRSDLVVILDDLADLLRTRREPWDVEMLYTLGHAAIRKFLTEDKDWQKRLAKANRDLAKLAVRRYGKDWSAVDPFDPGERYLLFHLLDHATAWEIREPLLRDEALAAACLEHGERLSNQGRFELALAAYGVTLTLRLDQVECQGRRDLRSELAAVYMNRGNAFTNLGRLEEALGAYSTSTNLYDVLVHGEGQREFLPDLAKVCMNGGNALRAMGRLKDALVAYDPSIEIYEELVQLEGRRDLRSDLATVFMNRGVALLDLGRLDDALTAHTACVRLRHSLV
jgi:tetratricopeptide (TPR) repeat protein